MRSASATLGRPEGYLARQVARWTTQYAGSRTRDLPDLDALAAALAEGVPATAASGLLHGDFRLDNAILTPDGAGGASIAAVLDWEMATIGDVLADLTLCTLYWRIGAIAAEAGAPVRDGRRAGRRLPRRGRARRALRPRHGHGGRPTSAGTTRSPPSSSR